MILVIKSVRLCFGAFEYYTAYSTLALLLRNKNIWRYCLAIGRIPSTLTASQLRLNYSNRF